MAHWNYRVMLLDGEYGIHEVYYRDDGTPYAYTEEPCRPSGETPDELRSDLTYFLAALEKPVLDAKEVLPSEPSG